VAAYRGDLLSKLVEHRDSLDAADRITLLHDLASVINAGHAKISTALDAAQAFANAPERAVSGNLRTLVAGVRKLVPPVEIPNYERYVRKLFSTRAAQLGWSSKPGEDDETRLLRAGLVLFVAREGGDANLQAEARRLADGWLTNHKGVDADMLRPVLFTAAWSGDQDLFDRLLHALKSTQDAQERQVLLDALNSFGDPRIVRQALGLLLDPDLDMRETFSGPPPGIPGNRQRDNLAFEFVKANYEPLVKRMPSIAGMDYRAFLPLLGASLCDEPSRKEFVTFFQERVKDYVGGPRIYANALETIRLCEARRDAQAGEVAQFFSQQ
jgi:hypothetical protein